MIEGVVLVLSVIVARWQWSCDEGGELTDESGQ